MSLVAACGTPEPGTPRRGEPLAAGVPAAAPQTPPTLPSTEGSAGANVRRLLDGEWCEVVTATAEAATYDDARNRAINSGRASLLALQRQRIKQDLRDFVREELEGDSSGERTRYREEMESVLVARTEGELQRCRVLESAAAPIAAGFRGVATVACPERVIFPTRRLQALVQRADTAPAAFSELAMTYEGEGQNGLAEQALRWGYDRGGGAEAALTLAKHFGRRALDADALRWCEVAARDAKGTPLAAEAAARADELRQRVDSADRLIKQLVQVAESKQDRARFSAYVLDRRRSATGIEWDVRWQLRGDLDRRVLKMWLDDSLTPAWWAEDESDEPKPSARDGGVRFALDKDAPPARVLFWSLPLDSELWPRLVAWKNVEVQLSEATDVQRLQLRDLMVALRNSNAVAAVVSIEP